MSASTSAQRRASCFFDTFPLLALPNDCPAPDDDLGYLAWEMAAKLSKCFPPAYKGAFTPEAARVNLAVWCTEVAKGIEESSKRPRIDARLCRRGDLMIQRMQVWLDGEWNADREALSCLCWRIGFSRQTVSAAMWLHCFGSFTIDEDNS